MNNKKLKEDPRADAVFQFAAMLTEMKEPVTFSGHHSAAPAADLAAEFIKKKGWENTFRYTHNETGKFMHWLGTKWDAFTYRWMTSKEST